MTPGFLRLATSEGVPRRSMVTALVVGSILTAINQGDVILAGSTPSFYKIALNYFVPFCVATYGAVSMRRTMLKRGGGAAEGC
ncbi:MAG: nitrate/nitrite transporter NrtS [Kiloniellales bacterium]|nr:nitrate/nitrite transporter NrtS [Kiloniellales bacterium]